MIFAVCWGTPSLVGFIRYEDRIVSTYNFFFEITNTLISQKKFWEPKFLAQRHIFWIDIFYMAARDIGSNMEFQKFCIFREQEMARRLRKIPHIPYSAYGVFQFLD